MKTALFVAFCLFANVNIYAQTTPFGQLEPALASNSAGASASSPTTGPVSYTLLNNSSNPLTFVAYNPALTVTASIINNQYSTNNNATNQAVFFNAPQWDNMAWIDNQGNNYWSTDQFNIGAGITNNNYGYRLMTFVQDIPNPVNFYQVAAGVTYTYMADMVVTFSRPVNNPIMQICGLGGTAGTLRMTTELKLTTPNISLLKLSGNNIGIDSVTKIVNTLPSPGGGNASGVGSFQLVGTGITSLTFRISLRTNNAQNTWNGGDAWTFSFSLAPPQTVSGKLFYDANGLTNGTVDGTGTNLSGTMYANMVDQQGKIISQVPVAADGSYNFPEAFTGSQTIQLTSTAGIAGNTSVASLPAGWAFTGENIGTGPGNDGTQDGITPVTVLQSTTSNADFGVEQMPSGANYTATTATNAGGNTKVTVPAAAFTGSDAEDGVYTPGLNGKTVTLTPAVNGTLYYNNATITAQQTINPFNPAMVSIDPDDNASATLVASFNYTVFDAAGVSSAAKTISMPFTMSLLPLRSISLSGKYSSGSANLFWEVIGAEHITHYEIEKSSNASNFILAGTVNSKGDGNFSYTFNSAVDLSGTIFYYRIKAVDEDGKYFYSPVIILKATGQSTQIRVLPNPFVHTINIQVTVPHQTDMIIELITAKGQSVVNRRKQLAAGENNIALTDLDNIPSGSYIVNIIIDGQRTTTTVIKLKYSQ